MKDNKVVVWVSSATMGHNWSTELSRALMEGDLDSKIEVQVCPTDIYSDVTKTTERLRQADILVAFAGTPDNANNKNYEMAVFPTSHSKYKTMVVCNPMAGVKPRTMLESPDIQVRTCQDPVPLSQLVEIISEEVGRILDAENSVKPSAKGMEYNVGVAVGLVKCGIFKVRRKAWVEGAYIDLMVGDPDNGVCSYICLVSPSGHKSPWMPTQEDLMAEDYMSL